MGRAVSGPEPRCRARGERVCSGGSQHSQPLCVVCPRRSGDLAPVSSQRPHTRVAASAAGREIRCPGPAPAGEVPRPGACVQTGMQMRRPHGVALSDCVLKPRLLCVGAAALRCARHLSPPPHPGSSHSRPRCGFHHRGHPQPENVTGTGAEVNGPNALNRARRPSAAVGPPLVRCPHGPFGEHVDCQGHRLVLRSS